MMIVVKVRWGSQSPSRTVDPVTLTPPLGWAPSE